MARTAAYRSSSLPYSNWPTRHSMREAIRDQRFAAQQTSQPPENETPPGTTWAPCARRPSSSSFKSDSRPRGQLAKNASERLEDNQEHRGEQHERGELVEPAIPHVCAGIAVGGEVAQQPTAPDVIADQERDQGDLGVQPARGAAEPAEPQPDAEDDGQDRARRHESPVELALHQLEALDRGSVGGHRVIDEEARQVEKPREPGHHEDDVQRFHPEHAYSEKRLRAQ